MTQPIPEYIPNSGGSIVSRNLLDGRAPLRWAFREEAANPVDNGWRFLSEADDEDYINDPKNMEVASFNTVVHLEPAVFPILHMPVGTDLTIIRQDGGRMVIIDNHTGRPAGIPGT